MLSGRNQGQISLSLRFHIFLVSLRTVLSRRSYKFVAIIGGVLYGELYAFVTGVFSFYGKSPTAYFRAVGATPPYHEFYFQGPISWGNPVLIWYPNAHLSLLLDPGSMFSLLILSFLAGINFSLLAYELRSWRKGRKRSGATKGGFTGYVGSWTSAFFGTHSCCVTTLGTLLFSILPPASGLLLSFQENISWESTVIASLLLLVSILYSAGRMANVKLSGECSLPHRTVALPKQQSN